MGSFSSEERKRSYDVMASSSSKEPKRSCDVMASSSSKKSRRSYDVFLSFRGPDVRNHFLGHLYAALDLVGICTYIDNEELRKGEQISPALTKAIEESQIAVVVFSENYASSTWCLEELTKIMECKEKKGLMVLPVFYKVEPREVRGQKQSYGKAMGDHVVKFGKNSEEVKRWKKALYDAGCLSGWHFTDGSEAGFIQQIVREISIQLDQTPLNIAKYPVGIDSQVQELKTILNLQSKDDVLMVGLWGQGGVGKTTLAKAIYNDIFREFQGASFLASVRENSKNSVDLVSLQNNLLSQLLPGKKVTIYNVDGGSRLVQDRLNNKKVLIILDDVDNACQLNALAEKPKWFGEGSRIIITTRNKHLLTSHGIDHDYIYEVKALEDGEALDLLRKHAFLGNQEIAISSNLVGQVLHYARGLPLALTVLGALLCRRGEHEWKSTLQTLAKLPNEDINNVLKVSYNGLDYYEQQIFLHIACFFKGSTMEYIKKVLDSCFDFDTTTKIQILIERCLISEEAEEIQMHDLIQLMGMDIVQDEDRYDPRNRSRVWFHDDVLDVLSEDKETNAVQAIVLQLPKPEEMYIGSYAFPKMRKLRLLILLNVNNSFQGPIYLPNELRWFEWPNCGSTLEFSHGPKKLVGLDMRNGKIKAVPKQFKEFKKLKHINFHKCQSLVCMPDISYFPNLEELDLSESENLECVHESISCHENLQLLNLSGCSKLHFPNVLQSKNLLLLDLSYCPKLQRFPDIPDKIKSLHELCLVETSIEELPASVENLVSLEKLYLRNCKKLAILPSSIYRLNKLQILSLSGCSKLTKFPKMEEELSDPHMKTGFSKLWSLYLVGCNISELEFLENSSCFPELHSLHISYCQKLKEIHKIPRQLIQLLAESCKSLSQIPSNKSHVQYVYLNSSHELVSSGLTMDDLFNLKHFNPREHFRPSGSSEFLLPGGEMPQWLLPNNEGYISFTVSKDIYKKFIALAICVVFHKEERIECFNLWLHALVNGKRKKAFMTSVTSSLLDHVCLQIYEVSQLWGGLEDAFGADDRSQFHLMIRAATVGTIVKKCGFRLICKFLENDVDVLLEDDMIDPAILYEILNEENEDYQISIEEEENGISKAEWEDEFTVEKWRYSLILPNLRIVHPGGEMPEEFVLVEDNIISFVASQDFYDKLRGLALCVVVGVGGGENEISFNIVPYVNDRRWNVLSGTLGSFDSDHVWIQYLKPNVLWGVLEGREDFWQFDESYVRFIIKLYVSGGTLKRLGYVLRCTPLENDLKVLLEDKQLVDPAVLYEDYDGYPDEIAAQFVRRFSYRERETGIE